VVKKRSKKSSVPSKKTMKSWSKYLRKELNSGPTLVGTLD